MENLQSDDFIISLLYVEDKSIARDLLRKVRPYTLEDVSKTKKIIPGSLYEKIKDKI